MALNSNLAYELAFDYDVSPVESTRVKTNTKKRYRLKNKAKLRKMLNLLIVFSVAFTICFRYVQIYGQKAEISSRAAQLNALETSNTQLELNIEKMVDTKSVEEYATTVLGMKKPERYQVSYIVASGEDIMEVTKPAQNRTIFGIITDKLAGSEE